MANKKSTSKKKSTTTKKVNKKEQQKEYDKIIDSVGEFDADYKRIILVSGIIIIIFCMFYFLTVYITGKDTKNTTTTTSNTSYISYTEIMAGRSFSMPEEEYLVLYYDRSDSELLSTFSSLVADYRADEAHYALYTVNMGDALNQAYASDTSNWGPKDISELAIHGPTLIHFRNGSVVEYFEGTTDISNYLG